MRPITRSADRSSSDGNVISSNEGNGVNITGADAPGQHGREQHHRPDGRPARPCWATTRPEWPTPRPAR